MFRPSTRVICGITLKAVSWIGSSSCRIIFNVCPIQAPHNLQAQDPVLGAENLLVFDDGSFDEDDTFAITDWTAHIPKKVLNKNFGFAADSHAFDDIPATELYTFEGPNPPPLAEQMIKDPNGTSTLSYGLAFSQVPFINVPFGQYKIASAETSKSISFTAESIVFCLTRLFLQDFPIATTVAAAEVILEPGSMRELHWHPNSGESYQQEPLTKAHWLMFLRRTDEWDYFIAGEIRATVFASGTNSRTFNFQADDVGYIPVECAAFFSGRRIRTCASFSSYGHYLEGIPTTPCQYLDSSRRLLRYSLWRHGLP